MKKGTRFWIAGVVLSVLLCMTVFHYGMKKMVYISEELPKTYDYHYAMITDAGDSDFWDKVYESAKETGLKNNVYVERFGSGLAVEYTKNELIELAIQASVDGIILPGDEEEETLDLLDQAGKAGIPVVTVQTDCSGGLRRCFVGTNNYNLGQDYGKQIAEILKEKKVSEGGTVHVLVLMDEDRVDTSQNLILLGLRENVKKLLGNDRVIVDTELIDNAGSFRSEESIRDIFLNWSELPDIMVCLNEINTRCAFQAAVDYNKVGKVQILGYYDSDAILDAVAKEIVYATFAPDTEEMGKDCVLALDEYVKTGYTNGYMAVDTALLKSREAVKRLDEK